MSVIVDITFRVMNRVTRSVTTTFAFAVFLMAAETHAFDFEVSPAKVTLDRNFAQTQLLVAATAAKGATTELSEDFTSRATFASSAPSVVTVSDEGRLLAINNGKATITVTVEGVAK